MGGNCPVLRLPMLSWLITQFAMRKYSLTGEKMAHIQLVNANRKDAIAEGMSMEEAMKKYI